MPDDKKSIQTNSIKTALSLSCSVTTQMKNDKIDLTSNCLIIVTAAGTIYGTTISHFSDDKAEDILFSSVYKQAQKIVKPEAPDYCLILKDAVLISGQGVKQTFNTLFVFPEDIIAITIGNPPNI